LKSHIFLQAAGVVAACICAPVSAQPLAYPGSTWGQVIYPSGLSLEERENTLLSGRVEQGVDWFRFGNEQWKFNTYAAVGYSTDTKGLPYNNKVTPALGFKISRSFETGVLDLGLQAVHERRWKANTSDSGLQVYASWWFGWDARRTPRN
jgi:hypothetical protein